MVPLLQREVSHLSYPKTVAFTFITHPEFSITLLLAHMLDSLVRVSRRVNENHFVSIPNVRRLSPTLTPPEPISNRRPAYQHVFDIPTTVAGERRDSATLPKKSAH